MQYTTRHRSVISEDYTLELLHEIKDFPVFIATTTESEKKDLFADMDWYICKQTGVIQLKKLLPLDLLYSGYHSEAIGATWKSHHMEFSKFLEKYVNKSIIEIGGSNGNLAQLFIDRNEEKEWTIIEPNPIFSSNEKIKVINGFFDKSFLSDSYDSVVHSHVFEHMYDPNEFLNDISCFMKEGEYHVFSIPNLEKYLRMKFCNTINFEHTFFLTEDLMDYMLSVYKFEVIEKYYFDDHSIFYATKKNSLIKKNTLPDCYQKYKKLYFDFVNFYLDEIKRLNDYIANYNGKIYLFGAHIFSQYLIYMGLNCEKIEFILDNSKEKNGQRLYGSSMVVQFPSILSSISEPCAVILKAGQYQEEVRKQFLSIKSDITIWE